MSKANLENLAISETGFVFDPRSGATFTVNPTGLVVLHALREGLALEVTIERLRERFEAVAADAKDDVVDFVHVLRQQGLLPQDFKL